MTIPPVPADQRSAELMKTYRASARKRQQQRCALLHDRHQLGLAVAQQAAALLKQEFRAEKVVLFGSMLSLSHIHERSDVDLAVWGLSPQAYYRAVGCLLALNPSFQIDFGTSRQKIIPFPAVDDTKYRQTICLN